MCNKCRKASSLHFLGVHGFPVRRQRRFDPLPAIRRPDNVRRSTVEEPHRHLDNADVSGTNARALACVCVCVYRAEAVAVQTVSVMVALDPEVTIWDFDVTILVVQSPAVKTEDVLMAPLVATEGLAFSSQPGIKTVGGRSFLPDEVSFQADDAFNDLLLGVLRGPGGTEEASEMKHSGVTVWTTQTSSWRYTPPFIFILSSPHPPPSGLRGSKLTGRPASQ